MAKIWATLFAQAGDKQTIPVPVEADGTVSVTQGWTPDYELPDTDPNYKPVGREEMNGVFNEVTDSIKQLQLQGAAEWSALLGAYPKGAEVIHSGERWYNTTAGNTTTPGVGANWINVRTVASETVAGIAENATQAETDAGTAGNFTVTPAKLRNGFAVSLNSNGYIKLPSWLGGFILQWGNIGSGAGVVTFPLVFPTACRQAFALLQAIGEADGSTAVGAVWVKTTSSTSTFSIGRQNNSVGALWLAVGH